MSFRYYSNLFLEISKTYYKISTFDKVSGIVKNRLNYFNEYEITHIKTSFIKTWIFGISDVGIKSKKHYLGVLSQIFDLALNDDVITRNPVKSIKLPKYIKTQIKPFLACEVLQILKESEKYNLKFQMFLKMGFYTGMRTGEILALKIKDIDLNRRIIYVNSSRSRFGESSPKTKNSVRKIPIMDVLFDDLKSFVISLKNNFYLFETQYKKPYKDDFVFTRLFWRVILNKLNLEYRRLYSMRHTFATNILLNSSLTPLELSKILGHSNCEMVYKIYASYVENLKDNFKRNIQIY